MIPGYVAGLAGVAFCVIVLLPFRASINSTPVALSLLLIVLFTAAQYGSIPAITVSVASVLCFNYFFLPPYGTLTIADPQNWAALAAFLVTALIAGRLSAGAKRRAEEAEKKQREIELLYEQLKQMLEKAHEADVMRHSEQLKSALLDAVTHDLRTPLTSMKAAVTTLLAGSSESWSGLDEEGRREMLDVINAEIDRLNHHLEGLIEIAKIEAGAMEPRRVWTSMDEIVSNSLARASVITSNHNVKIQIPENLPLVRVDEKGISEVIYLLLENATKYSASGSQILLAVQAVNPGVQVLVEDHGIGIPVELREKVFDKFFRGSAEPQHAALAVGLGMGLAIARALVEAHGGRIWIEDATGGRGTRVCFTIPVQS